MPHRDSLVIKTGAVGVVPAQGVQLEQELPEYCFIAQISLMVGRFSETVSKSSLSTVRRRASVRGTHRAVRDLLRLGV
jgi:hypothetical protein